MEIYSTDSSLNLVEADVVETLEARTVDCPNAVVGYEKVFFPPHKDVLLLRIVLYQDIALLGLLRKLSESAKLCPMRQVNAVVGAPRFVLGHETVLGTDDFALEIRRQGRMVLGQACE